MTLAEVLERIDRERPGESTEEEKLRWLSQVDGQWYREMVLTHEGAEETTFAPYTTDGDKSVALLIAPPYDEVYIHFLYMQTDQRLGEIDRYNNDAALYNQGMLEARQAYNREHMPLQKHSLRNILPAGAPVKDRDNPLA